MVNVLNLQGNNLCAKLTLLIKAKIEISHQICGLCLGGQSGKGGKRKEPQKGRYSFLGELCRYMKNDKRDGLN